MTTSAKVNNLQAQREAVSTAVSLLPVRAHRRAGSPTPVTLNPTLETDGVENGIDTGDLDSLSCALPLDHGLDISAKLGKELTASTVDCTLYPEPPREEQKSTPFYGFLAAVRKLVFYFLPTTYARCVGGIRKIQSLYVSPAFSQSYIVLTK